jgi:hypothetical protein
LDAITYLFIQLGHSSKLKGYQHLPALSCLVPLETLFLSALYGEVAVTEVEPNWHIMPDCI